METFETYRFENPPFLVWTGGVETEAFQNGDVKSVNYSSVAFISADGCFGVDDR